MGCFSGSQESGKTGAIETLRPFQLDLLEDVVSRVRDTLGGSAAFPGQELAPLGPSSLQQQAFGVGAGLPGTLQSSAFGEFDPAQIARQFQPTADFARQGFQQETIPAIAGAAGFQGAARSSGFQDILAREARNLELGLASQLGQQQFGAQQAQLQRQAALPGITGQVTNQLAGLGALQGSFPEAQRQFELQRFASQQPFTNPEAGLIGIALGQPLATFSQQGFREPAFFGEGGAGQGLLATGAAGLFSSDKRLKEDIEPIDNALDKINKLDGKTYKFIFKDNEKDAGIIAQDLEKILPEAVVEKDGIKYVKYEAVIALLVNAVKELSAKVA